MRAVALLTDPEYRPAVPNRAPAAYSLTCDGCGAPLPAPKGRSTLTCSYCYRELVVRAGATSVQADRNARSITDALLRGHTGGSVGTGRRFTASEVADWADPTQTLWPSSASASSSFGMGWSASTLVGAPRVFPNHGDIAGAWAPGSRTSRVEWIEVGFPPSAPLARAVRVFETNVPGSTFAITRISGAGSARREELIWQAPPQLAAGGARILEVELPSPQPLERVRVYVANDLGSSWSEIDTVGLVTLGPVPKELQRRPSRVRMGCIAWVLLGAVASICVAGWLVSDGESAVVPPPAPPTEVVQGPSMMAWNVERAGMSAAGVVWAARTLGFSSQYDDPRNAASQALGAPDVYPSYGDRPEAWAPLARDAGAEHIELSFSAPVRASAVVIVETYNPGALMRIDDISPGRPAALLWQGRTDAAVGPRVLSLELPAPREISALRVVLDTTRVSGWNEIDAVGLVPAP